jgi:hypothetical protein
MKRQQQQQEEEEKAKKTSWIRISDAEQRKEEELPSPFHRAASKAQTSTYEESKPNWPDSKTRNASAPAMHQGPYTHKDKRARETTRVHGGEPLRTPAPLVILQLSRSASIKVKTNQ